LSITHLKSRVAGWASQHPAVVSVETLGSFRRGAEPEDVDLMLVYDTGRTSGLEAMRELRPGLRETVRTAIGLKADITLLSPGERAEPGFPLDPGSVEVLYSRN
jgi:predicted nucleotidyltransferase